MGVWGKKPAFEAPCPTPARKQPTTADSAASPVQLGRLPWSYDQVWRVYQKAAGIGGLGTHSRHTYRSWLDAVGTPVG